MSVKSIVHLEYRNIEMETDKGIKVDFGGGHAEWFPRSQVTISENEKVIGMPKWLYWKKFPDGVD